MKAMEHQYDLKFGSRCYYINPLGIYRDAGNGACEVCMMQDDAWNQMIDEIIVFSSQINIRG
jgi:hypothetical protein